MPRVPLTFDAGAPAVVRAVALLVVSLAPVALLGGAGPARATSSLAILPLAGDDAAVAATWTFALRDNALVTGMLPVSDDAVTSALGTASALAGECNAAEVACVARVGSLATADVAVGGRVDVVAAGVRLEVLAVDVATGALLRRASLTGPAEPDVATARLALLRAVAPDKERGYVAVSGAPAGATISVDGTPRGTAPLSELLAVPPGRHEIAIDVFERDTVMRTVDVRLGDTVVVDVGGTAAPAPGASDERPADAPSSGDAPPAAAAPEEVTVCLAPVRTQVPGGDGVAARFDAALRRQFHRTPGLRLLPLPTVEQDIDAQTAVVLGEGPGDVATLGARCLGATFLVEVGIQMIGNTRLLVVRAQRSGPLRVRSADAVLSRADVEQDLRQLAPVLLNRVFAAEGLRFRRAQRGGLPPWVLWTTIGTGTGFGLLSLTAGALYAADVALGGAAAGGARPVVALALGTGLAASALLAGAVVLELPQLPP
jgi:hypothetical protein